MTSLWNYNFLFFLAVDPAIPHRQNFIIKAMGKELKGKSKILCVERPICPLVTPVRYPNKFLKWLGGFAEGKYAHIRKVMENAYIYTPFVFLHDQLAARISPIVRANRRLLSREIEGVLAKLDFDRQHLITWAYNPYQIEYIDLLPQRYLIYDCYDDFLAPTIHRGKSQLELMRKRERQILERADIVFAASAQVTARQKHINPCTYLVPNAADYEHFKAVTNEETPIPNDMASIKPPIIGFVGTMNESIDFGLLADIAIQRPDWSLVLIGPFYSHERGFLRSQELLEAKAFKNIHFLGKRPYEDIPRYIKAFDVCIVPYKDTEFNRNRSPLKLYEYMASGKPIVTTECYQARSFSSVVTVARSAEDFVNEIERTLKTDFGHVQEQQLAIAEQNSWEVRAATMLEIVERSVFK